MDLIGSLQSPFIRSIIPMVVMLAFFYFVLVRPQKKREKTVDDMRNNLKVGDEILTIGGLMGKIIMVKEDYVVIESFWIKHSNRRHEVGRPFCNKK